VLSEIGASIFLLIVELIFGNFLGKVIETQLEVSGVLLVLEDFWAF
jgi:hypothetical protein